MRLRRFMSLVMALLIMFTLIVPGFALAAEEDESVASATNGQIDGGADETGDQTDGEADETGDQTGGAANEAGDQTGGETDEATDDDPNELGGETNDDPDEEPGDEVGGEVGSGTGDQTDDDPNELGGETHDDPNDEPGDEVDGEVGSGTGDQTDGETDGEADDQTDGETDADAGDQTDGETDAEADDQTDGEIDAEADGETGGEIEDQPDESTVVFPVVFVILPSEVEAVVEVYAEFDAEGSVLEHEKGLKPGSYRYVVKAKGYRTVEGSFSLREEALEIRVTLEQETAKRSAAYTIRFFNDGTEMQSSSVAGGETPSYTGDAPTKAADAQGIYSFKGWSPEIVPAEADADYVAAYDSVDPVARLDEDEYYASVEDAIGAVPDNGSGTITLLQDETQTGRLYIEGGKKITLHLNGHVLPAPIYVESGASLTVNGGSGGSITPFSTEHDTICNNGTLIINSGTVECASNDSGIYAIRNESGTTTVNDGTVRRTNGSTTYAIGVDGGTVTVKGGTIIGNDTGIYIANGGTLKIRSYMVDSVSYYPTDAATLLYPVYFYCNDDLLKTQWVEEGGTASAPAVDLAENEFWSLGASVAWARFDFETTPITEETFLYVGSSGDDPIVGGDPVAMIDETPYTSLAAAVADATNGQTIRMVEDTDESGSLIPYSGGRFTLDMSGHTVTIKGFSLADAMDLTLMGGGKLELVQAGDETGIAPGTDQKVDLTISGTNVDSDGLLLYSSGAGSTFKMISGHVECEGAGTAEGGKGVISGEGIARVTVLGGSIVVKNGHFIRAENAVASISGGTISAPRDREVVRQAARLTVTGGTLIGGGDAGTVAGIHGTDVSIVAILGGYYTQDVTGKTTGGDAWLENGYICIRDSEDSDGNASSLYRVLPGSATVTITGTKTWVDDGRPHANADEINLTLSRISAKEGSRKETLDEIPVWEGNTYSFCGQPTYDDEHYLYAYSVEESSCPAGYTSTQEGNDFTNTLDRGPVVIASSTKSWTYDGQIHTDEVYTVTFGETSGTATACENGKYIYTLPTGDTLTITPTATGVKDYSATYSHNNTYTYALENGSTFSSVTANFGTLSIVPKTVTLISGSKSREYNGRPLTNAEVENKNENGLIVETGWVGSEGATYSFTGSVTSAGPGQPNAFTYTLKPDTNAGNYHIIRTEGTLTITRNTTAITVVPGSGEKIYDGVALTKTAHDDFTVTGVPEGFTWTAKADGTVTNVVPGTDEKAANAVTEFRILKDDADVTDQFSNIDTGATGTLTIRRRPVTFTGETAAKTYTGSEIRLTAVKVSTGENQGLLSGHAHNVTYIAEGTEAGGPYDGIITAIEDVAITAGSQDVTANYAITVVNGQLTIQRTTEPFTIRLDDDEYGYDGDEHCNANAANSTAATGVTAYGYSFDENGTYVTELTALKKTDAGEYTIYVKATNPNYMNAAAATAKLTIKPAAVTVTAQDKAFCYTGEAQSWPEYTVSGLIGGDRIAAVVEGSIRFPGQSPVTNKLKSYEFTVGTPSNYAVETKDGVLTMTNASVAITITAASATWEYDGTVHRNPEVTVTAGQLLPGDELVAEATGSVTDVKGTAEGNNPVAAGYRIMHGDEDVTDNYAITTVAGTLTIRRSVLKISVRQHSYPYTGSPQGPAGTYTEGFDRYVTVEGQLWGNDRLISVTLTGQQTNAGVYEGEIGVAEVVIGPKVGPETMKSTAKTAGRDAGGNYEIECNAGTLTIEKAPLTITAKDQTFAYSGAVQGENHMTYADSAKVQVEGLLGRDELIGITLDGQERYAGEYSGRIVPSAAVISARGAAKAAATEEKDDPAGNYEITYVAGKLTITKAELVVTAKDRAYTYNGSMQGPAGTYTSGFDTHVTVTGLKGSDKLTGVTLNGQARDVGEYADRIVPSAAELGEATDSYEIAYVPGKLVIRKRSDSTPPTGDRTKALLWSSLLTASTIGCGGALWLAFRKKREVGQ